MKKVFVLGESQLGTTRVIQLCKNCGFKCEKDEIVFGCERIMASVPSTTISGITFDCCCVKRIWFDKNYVPVEFWREPTREEFDNPAYHNRYGWEQKMDAELEELKKQIYKRTGWLK